MEKLEIEQTETQSTEIAEAKGKPSGEGESVSLGKFKDVNALLNAYNSLESEFTKRCQRIKELEALKPLDKTEAPDNTEKDSPKEKDVKEILEGKTEKTEVPSGKEQPNDKGITERSITAEEKEEILKGYLKEIIENKSRAILLDGVGVGIKTPSARPKTIKEAGNLARDILAK